MKKRTGSKKDEGEKGTWKILLTKLILLICFPPLFRPNVWKKASRRHTHHYDEKNYSTKMLVDQTDQKENLATNTLRRDNMLTKVYILMKITEFTAVKKSWKVSDYGTKQEISSIWEKHTSHSKSKGA